MEQVTYKQLMLLPEEELTEPQKTFLTVHNEMLMAGQKAADCACIMATDLKRMRDEKLYEAAGFESFKDYVENALNIKERQAYNWINVLALPTEYLQQNASLGVTKLALIASASEEVQEKIMEKDDVGSVRELTAEIKRLEAENAKKEKQINLLEDDLQERDERIKELEDVQPEPDSNPEFKKAIEEKEIELTKAKQNAETLKQKALNLENQLKVAKAVAEKASKEVKTVPDEESKKQAAAEKARADELEQKLKETNAQLAAAKEQKKTIASDDLLTFKIKFTDLQRLGGEIKKALDGMNDENAGKCRAAINAVLNGWRGDMKL